jgi:peptide chain release factor 1
MLDEKLSALSQRHEELTHLLSQPEILQDSSLYRKLTLEHSELQDVVSTYSQLSDLLVQIKDNGTLVSDPKEDKELQELAQQELVQQLNEQKLLEQRLQRLLLPRDPNDQRNVILEIRAGTGGVEAALFARDLFRMYGKYAENLGWRVQILSEHENDLGGFKEITASVEGSEVFANLKFEAGVHRVQRIPRTETQGRIHTSAATVAIMPDVEEVEVEINPSDLRIDVFRASGPGGQSVNTTDSAVRIVHLPSAIVVSCQNEKSQLKNKNQALKVLRARLYEAEQEARQQETSAQRKSMVGSGDRSERIRTYNFPQNRITDHRINLTLYKLEEVMIGKLEFLTKPLRQQNQMEQLKNQGVGV